MDFPKILYGINASLLITHEIDSAYWHEWTLFRLPGGIGLFLLLNLVLVAVVFYGFYQTITWHKGARGFSGFLGAAGIFAFALHIYLILAGHPEFRSAISIGLLVAALLVSTTQLVFVVFFWPGNPQAGDAHRNHETRGGRL